MSTTWPAADPLGEALFFLRMTGTFTCRSELTAPWALDLPPFPDAMMFHAVTSGRCLLEVDGVEPRELRPGDFALVPHGEGHRLSSAAGVAGTPLFDAPRERVGERYEILRLGGGGEPTEALCGVVRFDHPAARHLVRALPRALAVEATDAPHAEWMRSTLELIAAEARSPRLGGETVVTRLADVLVVQTIRAWVASDPAARTGWLGALTDRQIGRAVTAIHRDPARGWTLASLADEAAMSRSAFAERFTALVGEPAMRYVARWRMYVALGMLREDDARLGELAERLGYQSEAAFSRAFKRVIGVSPGAARRGAPTA